MDSGASFHATHCKDLMLNFRLGNFGKVRLDDDETLDIAGMGGINLKTSLGTSWTLKDVRYIPGLKKMLISVGQIYKEGYRVSFENGQWKVIKGNLVVAREEKKGTLYIVEQSSYEANAVADEIGSSTLWHQRLGHMSENGMKFLTSKGKIPELKNVEVGFCEPCVLGKQKRVTFEKSGRTPKAKKLELVHIDVYGPTTVASLGGSRYYVTFINDSTRKVTSLMSQSEKPVLGPLYKSGGADFQKLSVVSKFKGQLFQLMQRLENTTPHFIRCINPNNFQSPGLYEQGLVLQQLRCSGVLEVVRISRSGFPIRITHQKFARRYRFYILDSIASQDPLVVSVSILHQFSIPPEMYEVGYTKLFFRTGQIGVLEDTRNRTLRGILHVQSCFKGYQASVNLGR